ncbi:uncharacterized protein LOC143210564 isoform X2 [Lasioglossum baleicum]|uniref:uncharacterized protein LOC143210564 isoform X2 n=1 Tax=Lasioglossum baleicum TaxID=434251 RepID=UPI003FCD478E
MEPKVPLWIPLIASIVAVTNAAFAHAPAADITRTVSADKGGRDNRDHEVNAHEEHGPGDRYNRQSYKDGSIVSKYDSLGPNLSGRGHRNGPNGGVKGAGGDSDDYTHDYNHDYRHSHGYRSYHRHSDGGKDGDDGYHGHYRVQFGQDHEGKDDGDRGVDQDDYKQSDYHYNNGFEIHFGDGGKENDRQGSEPSNKQGLNDEYNKGVDNHGPDHHYAYTEGGGNHGKDYPNFGDDRHYRHHKRDHDHWNYRYGVVHSDH